MIDRLTKKLDGVVRRHDELIETMGLPDVAVDYEKVHGLAKERASLDRIVTLYRGYKKTVAEIGDTQSLLSGESDLELATMVKEEMVALQERRERLVRDIQIALLPVDPNDEKSVIVEVRAGAGGDEGGGADGDQHGGDDKHSGQFLPLRGFGLRGLALGDALQQDVHGVQDRVFNLLPAKVVEHHLHLIVYRLMHVFRDTDAAALGQRLKP